MGSTEDEAPSVSIIVPEGAPKEIRCGAGMAGLRSLERRDGSHILRTEPLLL